MTSLMLYLLCLTLTVAMARYSYTGTVANCHTGKALSIEGRRLFVDIRSFYAVIGFIPLWVVIAFRDLTVGDDAKGTQYYIFRRIAQGAPYDSKAFGSEIGYYLLNRVCVEVGGSYHLVLIVTGTISWLLFYNYIIKNSRMPDLSYIVFFLNFYYFHQFNVMRQFLACGFILLGFECLKKGNVIKYIFLIGIATTFHYTAIIALPFLFLRKMKIDIKSVITFIVVSKIGFGALNLFLDYILQGTRYYAILKDPRAYENGYLLLEIAVSVSIFAIACFVRRQADEDEDYNFNMWLQTLSVIVAINSNIIPIPYRIIWYMNLNNMIFVPELIIRLRNKKNGIIAQAYLTVMHISYFIYAWVSNVDAVQTYSFWKH